MMDWISFTTDYGVDDGFAAACHGVIGRIAPRARVIDITHTIPPGDIRRGARVLADTVVSLPVAVHLAVVDPGVGTSRRGIVLVAREGLLVGPDNGLLLPAAAALGGGVAAHELTAKDLRLPEVSRTFHGRDVFAPAAAHLANGVMPEEFGAAITVETLVRLPQPRLSVTDGVIECEVRAVDRFGNAQLSAGRHELAVAGLDSYPALTVRIGRRTRKVRRGGTFADGPPGAPVLFVDSAARLAIAYNGGSAAEALELREGTAVTLQR